MNEKIVKRFLEQKFKLVKENIALYGRILEVDNGCIVFQTNDRTPVIKMDLIIKWALDIDLRWNCHWIKQQGVQPPFFQNILYFC